MDNLVGPIVELGKCLYVPFKRHCGYLCCYAKNVKELEDEVDSMKTQREDMNEKLDEESRLNRTPLPGVKKWMGSVDKAVVEAEILSGQMKEEQRCLMGWCPNLRWRHGVGRKASKQIDQVQQLKEKGDGFGTIIARPRPPADVEEIRSGNEFVATGVATTVMEQVMKALRDNNVRSVGIYGMGGIGKTTLVNNISNKLKGSGLFDKVIFVTVSQNPNLNVIQDQIAERLGMRLDDKVNYLRANRLLEELMKLKSVLIILDDVWTEVKVEELGLSSKNEHGCCKIIVTTRKREVCAQMGMDTESEVKPLSYKDAWVLFESKVGDVSKNQKLLEIGEGIVKECGGCPLAIVTLGSTLAQQEECIWRDALTRLESSELTELDGIFSKVITSIKFSYDHLNDHGMKFCFLFCSLFPEDDNISLEDLRIFGIGEGFLHVQGKCLDAKVRLMAYIVRLKNCSLLLEGDMRNCVKMHDVVRLTALSIASKEGHGFIEKTRLGLTHWPRLDNEEECKRLSLIGNYYIEALPNSSNFPQLRTLLLKGCFGITHIPNDFFKGMRALVNLDLSHLSSPIRWPKSISLATNLRSLLLGSYGTSSYDLDDLTKLKNLEVLIIYDKVKIPVELGELSNLKILNLDKVHLELIPANVISRLHNLEELYLDIMQFDDKEGGCKGSDEIRSAASLVEVAALKRLTILQVRVREEEILLFQDCSNMMPNKYGWGHELQEFKIVSGNNFLALEFFESGNSLVLSKLPKLVPEWVICLIQKVECLRLIDSNCSTILHIASTTTDQGPSSSSAHYNFETRNCLEHLVDLQLVDMLNLVRICDGPVPDGFLKNLKDLQLVHMPNLVRICNGLVPDGFLKNLKRVIVRNCGKLIPKVFAQDLVHCTENIKEIRLREFYSLDDNDDLQYFNFPSLEKLYINEIEKMETLISSHLFQNITFLSIKRCPTLKSICSFDSTSSTGSTSTIAYSIFPKLEHLYLKRLEKLDTIIWTGSNPLNIGSSSFQNLRVLQVGYCKSLRYLFTPLLAKHLPHLESLKVKSCVRLEKLILISDGEEESTSTAAGRIRTTAIEDVLPQLRCLDLRGLPELTSVFSVETIFLQFQSLKLIRVFRCSQLKHLSLGPNNSPLLKEITGTQEWFQALEENMTMETKSRFKPLFR